MFLPRRDDPARGEPYSADLLPLELLRIAGAPDAEGYEIVLIDAMVDDDALERVLEACDGALCFASSCILGYQVWDGYVVARAVRQRYPQLPIVWGGWFPSVAPELYFNAGVADVVALGQGELTFLDIVHALESGASLEEVAGVALWRDKQLVRTAPRAVVGFDKTPSTPWRLLDFARYAEKQRRQTGPRVRHRMPRPRNWRRVEEPIGFSFFSSYGCPTECTFCCSPIVTGRRWKAVDGRALADEVLELQARFGFDVVRFNDANWGVAEKRARSFADALIERGASLHWNATIEIDTVLRYSEATLDAVADSGCHLFWLGAETGSAEMQQRIKKHLDVETVSTALARLVERDITTGCFWIIGFPGETHESMEETLRRAARVKHEFPGCASEVYPFRPVPGTEDYDHALRLGWPMPNDFEGWGRCFEWKWNSVNPSIPPELHERWRRYIQTAAIYDQHVREGPAWMRRALARTAGWRLSKGRFGFPVEQKLFDLYVRGLRRTPSGVGVD